MTTSPAAAARTVEPVGAPISIPSWYVDAPFVGDFRFPNPEVILLEAGQGQIRPPLNILFELLLASIAFSIAAISASNFFSSSFNFFSSAWLVLILLFVSSSSLVFSSISFSILSFWAISVSFSNSSFSCK